jgi:hypothetical protein
MEHLDPFAAINPFQRYDPYRPNNPLAATVVAQWEQELSKPDFLQPGDQWHSKEGRNELIYRLIFIADYRFSKYEADLMTGRAAGDTATDIAVLGLTSAASITPYAGTARILSAIAGGLTGSRAVLQKNFYQNQTVSVLLDRMRALRKERFNQIVLNLQQPYSQYPVELAVLDTLDYFNRGTMLGALQDISDTTAIKQITAEGGSVATPSPAPPVSKQIRISSVPSISTPATPLSIPRLSAIGRRLKQDLGAKIVGLNNSKDYSTASKILQSLGMNPAPTGEDAVTTLSQRLASAKTDQDLIPLEDAFHNASIETPANPTSPQGSPTPTPQAASSSTPTPTPIPLATPHNAPNPSGQLNN